jgi:hypothetical protein
MIVNRHSRYGGGHNEAYGREKSDDAVIALVVKPAAC